MRIAKTSKKRFQPQTFSGIVEIAITGLDTNNHRMTGNDGFRKSIRVLEATVEEVAGIIYTALLTQAED